MQENNPIPLRPSNRQPPRSQADKEWSELQRDLDLLGRQLAELSTHTAQLGEHVPRESAGALPGGEGPRRYLSKDNRAAVRGVAPDGDEPGRAHVQRHARALERGRQAGVGAVGAATPGRHATSAKACRAPGPRSAPRSARPRAGSTPSSPRRTDLRPPRAKIVARELDVRSYR